MNYRAVAYFLSLLLVGCGLFMVTSIIWAVFLDSTDTVIIMAVSTLLCIAVGLGLRFLGDKNIDALHAREAIAVVGLGWFAVSILGAVPFVLEGVLNPVDAFFEAVSGFTTTGATAITDLNSVSRALIYWRALSQWLGGMGIIVLFIAILPQLGIGAKHMFKSEVPGPISDGLKPKLKQTAGMLWAIYAVITAVETVCLMMAGMSFYDSICHSLACMATGGFSPRNESIAYYNDPVIEMIITVFMILAGVNFSLYYLILRRKFNDAVRDYELRTYFGILAVFSALILANTWGLHQTTLDEIIKPVFQAVSMCTTTGFGTEDSNMYPSLSKLLMVVLMFIGGSAGSTGGGMKVSRVIILAKAAFNTIMNSFQPHAVRAVKLGKRPVGEDVVREVLAFFVVYIALFLIGSLVMSTLIPDQETPILSAFSASIACFANIGPGFGVVGATENYAVIPAVGKIVLSILMIVGRLELFTVLVLFLPGFWKK
jgi:trk system potassium uptake protein TrkH